jgi:pyruvate/2-oxoglutarate dehydrogenase complex dihydrolipoamide dehydrogenase (E3) component
MQTTNDNVFAVGDVCTRFQFTHAADFMARSVIRNALFFANDKFSKLLIPWATYTSPEVAHVGAYASDLTGKGVAFDVYEKRLATNDRAILDAQTTGLVRILCKKGSDVILGATIVAEHAGDMISEITLAMQSNTGLGKMASVIHPYPTQADAIRALGDMYNRTRLTPMVRMVLRSIVSIHRAGKGGK